MKGVRVDEVSAELINAVKNYFGWNYTSKARGGGMTLSCQPGRYTVNFIFMVPCLLLIKSNKMQQYEGIYLLQNYSTYFGCPSHPSSGVLKTVTAASGTGHITYPGNNLPPAWPN